MSWPFTPTTAFVDNTTPRISAGFINDVQAGINAAALAGYSRVRYTAKCQQGTSVTIRLGAPVIVKDSATGQFVTVDADGVDWSIPAALPAGWGSVFLTATNGIVGFDMTTTAPDQSLRTIGTDETKRYICAVYSTGSTIRSFHARDGVYKWEEQVPAVGNPYASALYTWQSVNLESLNAIAPTASAFSLQATMSAVSAAFFALHVRSYDGTQNGGSGAGYARQVLSVGNGGTARQDATATLSFATRAGANLFEWRCTSTSSTTAYVSIEVDGFEE